VDHKPLTDMHQILRREPSQSSGCRYAARGFALVVPTSHTLRDQCMDIPCTEIMLLLCTYAYRMSSVCTVGLTETKTLLNVVFLTGPYTFESN